MIEKLKAALEANGGSNVRAAESLGMNVNTFKSHLLRHRRRSEAVVEVEAPEEEPGLIQRVKFLESELRKAADRDLTTEVIRRRIIQLDDAVTSANAPNWMINPATDRKSPGVPTLFCSDWHIGEVVNPDQINGVNEFNMAIAQDRVRRLVASAFELLEIISPSMDYPGIVCVLGGDMISGNIHEELTATNELNTMPTVLELFGWLKWMIRQLADKFGRVFVPCVTGNHGRDTHKIWNKDRTATSFDWLLYSFLAKDFENDTRVQFYIPDGPDAYYRIFDHRYLLTHGDQFRGGDGMIGALGPIMRGNHKKKSRNSQIDMEYDTMIIGHWHQYIHLNSLIVNGCFPKGTGVITERGPTPIEEVRVGDSVISRDSTKQTVTHIFEKTSERLVGLKIRGLPEVLQATPNHLVWAVKGNSKSCDVTPGRRRRISETNGVAQWIPIDFISPGDFVHVPHPSGSETPVTEEDAWAYGLFLAEGSALLDAGKSKKHNRISLTMHKKEEHIVRRWAAWFLGRFGKECRITVRDSRNTCDLAVSAGRDVSVWFRDTFGHLAKGKHLPEGALRWADNLKRLLLEGWVTGDGHRAEQSDCRPTISATSISPVLAWQMFYLAFSTGLTPALSVLRKGGVRKNDVYTIHFNSGQESINIDGESFFRVQERFETVTSEAVYDLEVSGEHTYVVEGVGVHNSIKGYDEYAYNSNFGFEPPQQALWITHPKHRITFRMPVYVDKARSPAKTEWISWKK